ncbi:MAG: TIGR00153 family protein [Gemmatimonadota bacterium]
MRTTSPIAALFGKSPFRPMQEHMAVVTACAEEMVELFEALIAGDQAALDRHKEAIFRLESEADELKHELRSHLPRSLLMPVNRRDLLDLLSTQDSIADEAEDVAALIYLRDMSVPEPLRADLLPFVRRVVDAVHKCGEIIRLLDELLETGFRGRETDRAEELIRELAMIETETDDMGLALVGILFRHEDEMKPLRVVYWQKLIRMVGRVADHAENAGDRLRLLIAS